MDCISRLGNILGNIINSCSYYETKDSTFDPNTAFGGTWTCQQVSYVEDVTARTKTGTIGSNFGSSANLTAPTVSGYTFVCWTTCGTSGWVASIYPASPASSTSSFFVATNASPGGSGSFYGTALYKKVVTSYRWYRTS